MSPADTPSKPPRPLIEVRGLVKHFPLKGKRAENGQPAVVRAVDGVLATGRCHRSTREGGAGADSPARPARGKIARKRGLGGGWGGLFRGVGAG